MSIIEGNEADIPEYLTDPVKVKNVLASFMDKVLRDDNFESVFTYFYKNLGINEGEWFPTCRIFLEKSSTLFRARLYKNGFTEVKKVEEIGINRIKPSIGRCNLGGQSIFYGSSNILCAISEVINSEIDATFPMKIVVGEWRLTQELQLCSTYFDPTNSELFHFCYPIIDNINHFPENVRESIIHIHVFFSAFFSKHMEVDKLLAYKFTNVFSQLMYGLLLDGVTYESLCASNPSMNFSISEKKINEGAIVCGNVSEYYVLDPMINSTKAKVTANELLFIREINPSGDGTIPW